MGADIPIENAHAFCLWLRFNWNYILLLLKIVLAHYICMNKKDNTEIWIMEHTKKHIVKYEACRDKLHVWVKLFFCHGNRHRTTPIRYCPLSAGTCNHILLAFLLVACSLLDFNSTEVLFGTRRCWSNQSTCPYPRMLYIDRQIESNFNVFASFFLE